jgi:hypothetical protein
VPTFLLAFLVIMPLAVTSATSDPLTWLVNLGVAGIVIVLLVTGQLRTKAEVSNLQAQIQSQAKLIEGFQTQLNNSTLPALTKFVQFAETIPENNHEIRSDIADLAKLMHELARQAREGGS